jgi:hypothetical protein
LLLAPRVPYWRSPGRPSFAHPWRELGAAALALVLVLGFGQAYLRGIRLPSDGAWRPVAESVNQLLIFSPIILLPVVRRQGWESVWLPRGARLPRLGIGIALSLVGLLVYAATEAHAPSVGRVLAGVYAPANAPVAVQVFLEDLTVAILVVRLAGAVPPQWAIGAAAALFAAGHVPSMLQEGASLRAFLGLFRDLGLGVLVLGTAWRGADILWIWPVHTALDLTQFLSAA